MKTYIKAVLEKKYFVSAEIIVILASDLFRMCRAKVTPEIPFPIMTMCSIDKNNALINPNREDWD